MSLENLREELEYRRANAYLKKLDAYNWEKKDMKPRKKQRLIDKLRKFYQLKHLLKAAGLARR